MRWIVVSLLLLTGCAGLFGEGKPDPAKVITQANAWQIEVNGLVRAARPLAKAVDAICDHHATQSRECLMAQTAWLSAKRATDSANSMIELYKQSIVAFDAVDDALELAQQAVDRVEATVIAIQEADNGLAKRSDPTGDGGVQPAAPQPNPAGGAAAGGAGGALGDAGPGAVAPKGGSSP